VRESPERPLAASLIAALRDRRLLLVLDNAEHLPGAAPDLAELLTSCPQLTVLVTSRAPLRLSGEHRITTSPLPLPAGGDALAPDRLATWPAIALFVDRARQVRPDFALDAASATTVLEICRRLDGLPLALELAAAWLRVLTPAALLARLGSGLALLAGGATDQPARQRTMRDAIAWSHDLLGDDEQRVFRRLAVFVGGFTLEAAERVTDERRKADGGRRMADAEETARPPTPRPPDPPTPSTTLDLLAGLVDKSLLQPAAVNAAEPRFTMLETVREFGLEQLAASGELAVVRSAHAAHYLELAEAAANSAAGAGGGDWLPRLAAEQADLRAALDWLDDTGETDASLRLASALWHYWYRHGDLTEGRTRLERALAAASSEADPAVLARALRGAGVLAWQGADYDQSRQRLEAALAAYRAVDDRLGAAWALNSLGCLYATLAETEPAESLLREALAIFDRLGDAVGIAQLTANLGELAEVTGRHDLAVEQLGAALTMWRALDDRVGAARAQVFLGQALLARDDATRAEVVLRDAIVAIRAIGYEQLLPAALRAVAQLAARRGAYAAAARWCGAEDGVREALGMELPAARRAGYERTIAAARESLGEAAFAAARASGRADPEGVIAALIDGGDAAGAAARTDVASGEIGRLTARERDVLRLVAEGRTDREIAGALFVTRRTVSKHVSTILNKLGVATRAAAAAIAAREGLA
jgi:non-specific serine/threonine protein kinase